MKLIHLTPTPFTARAFPCLGALLLAAAGGLAQAQTTAFTYQGLLSDGAERANGSFDLRFTLHDDSSSGATVAGPLTNAPTAVSNGLFTVTLDFGSSAFNGAERWIEIGVRTNGSADAFTTLLPRTRVTSAPYATRAGTATAFTGAVSNSQLPPNVARLDMTQTFTQANTFLSNLGIGGPPNVSRLTVLGDSTLYGNVGINAFPSYFAMTLRATDAPDNDYFALQENDGTTRWQINGFGHGLNFAETGVADGRLYLAPGGNVGIGTRSPASKLTLAGASGTALRLQGPGGSGATVAVDLATYDPAPLGTNTPAARLVATDANYSASLSFQTKNPGAANNPLVSRLFIDPAGSVGIGNTSPATKLDVSGEIACVAVNITSDRNAKTDFTPVQPAAVLSKVLSLSITEWQYKDQPDARHIGPMAQDFHAAFAVGRDERHITSVDADGVALAAIQGLNQKLEAEGRAKDVRIGELEQQLTELKALVARLAGQKEGSAR